MHFRNPMWSIDSGPNIYSSNSCHRGLLLVSLGILLRDQLMIILVFCFLFLFFCVCKGGNLPLFCVLWFYFGTTKYVYSGALWALARIKRRDRGGMKLVLLLVSSRGHSYKMTHHLYFSCCPLTDYTIPLKKNVLLLISFLWGFRRGFILFFIFTFWQHTKKWVFLSMPSR